MIWFNKYRKNEISKEKLGTGVSITGDEKFVVEQSTFSIVKTFNQLKTWLATSMSFTTLDATTLTATTATVTTLTATGATSLETVNYKAQVTDTGGAYATPIVLTTAQSGRVILVDDAAGLDFTLPAIATADIGTKFEFLVTVTISSNALRVTAATGDLLRGGVFIADFNTANTGEYFTPDESNDLIMTLNGSTTGGKKGTKVTFTAITATGWFVDGLVFGDGSLATPFS